MKKIILALLATILCFSFLACDDTMSDVPSDSSSIITFNSFDEIREMKDIIGLSDKEADAYIAEKSAHKINFSSKEEAESLLRDIENFEILYLDPAYGYELNEIEFGNDLDWVQYIYAQGEYGYLRIWTYVDKDYSKPTGKAEASLKIGDETVKLYSYNNEEMRYGLYGDLITDGYRIRISANESVDFERIGNYLTLTTISELIK